MDSIIDTPLDWRIEKILEKRDMADLIKTGPIIGIFISSISLTSLPLLVLIYLVIPKARTARTISK